MLGLYVGAANDDDVDSVSPRTLRQAADRLARFTSDQPQGEIKVRCQANVGLTCLSSLIGNVCMYASAAELCVLTWHDMHQIDMPSLRLCLRQKSFSINTQQPYHQVCVFVIFRYGCKQPYIIKPGCCCR